MDYRSRPLGGSPLVSDWLEGRPEALRFFSGPPGEPESYGRIGEELGVRFGREGRERVASLLADGRPGAADRLTAFVEDEGFVVTTGQQPGLFGGPLYTLYKAFTAVALARRLEEVMERPVVPVFWIASEDHDWEEARLTHLLDPGNELHEVALAPRDGEAAPPLHSLPMTSEVTALVERMGKLLPATDFSDRWLELLGRTHAPGATLPQAFQGILEALTADLGLFLVQSHAPALKTASLPLLLRELEGSGTGETALRDRAQELEEAGYPLQVPLLEDATNLFLEGPAGRERLFREGDGKLRLRKSGLLVTRSEVESRAREAPSTLSPNVLLRPVVEAGVFPTLSYVAGPGEVAYLPQTAPLFETHGVTMPVTHPRASLMLVEGKVDKVLEKFSLDLNDLARPHHEVAGRILRDEIPEDVRQALGELKGEVARGTGELAKAVRGVDPTLGGPVEHIRNQAFSLLDDMEKKVVQSMKREREVALAQLRKAQLNLFPLGKPQERVLNAFQYLVRYDRELLDRVAAAAAEAVLP